MISCQTNVRLYKNLNASNRVKGKAFEFDYQGSDMTTNWLKVFYRKACPGYR